MSRRKTTIGLAVLFALALSAFAASSASASGATAYTCVKNAAGKLYGDHCLSAPGGPQEYEHVAIAPEETTTGTVTNENSAENTTSRRVAILKGTVSGVSTEVQCAQVHGEGTFENRTTVKGSGEMFAHAEGRLHFTECTVTAPAGKGCKVGNGGTITTNQVTVQSIGNGSKGKMTPKEGGTFLELKLEGCSISGLNNTFPITGSLEAQTNGATLTATHAEITTQGTLKFAGQKAGLECGLTVKAHKVPKEGEEAEATKPLSITATP